MHIVITMGNISIELRAQKKRMDQASVGAYVNQDGHQKNTAGRECLPSPVKKFPNGELVNFIS